MSPIVQDTCSEPRPSGGFGGRLAEALARADRRLSIYAGGELDAVIDRSGEVHLLVADHKAIHREGARLREVFALHPDIVWILDEQGAILSGGGRLFDDLGQEENALVGRSFMAFVHPEDRGCLEEAFAELEKGAPRREVAAFRYQSGSKNWLSLEASVALLHASAAGRFIVNCRESRRVETQTAPGATHPAAAADLTAQMATSLAVLSHELRTPLTPVLLSIAMLREEPDLAHLEPTFAMMERNLKMQVQLIEELKDLARIGQHRTELALVPLDAHAAVGFVLGICAESIASLRIAVQIELKAPAYMVQADSLKLQQVIWNVLQNAVKFSNPGGTVSISSHNPGPEVFVLEIADQGAGIAADFLPLVFEPFKQSPASSRRKSGSLGLGMYIARGLAEAHHGSLTVTSPGPGYGCTFRLSLRTTTSESLAEPGRRMTDTLVLEEGEDPREKGV